MRSLIILIIFVTDISHVVLAQATCIPENQWFEPKTGELYSFENYRDRIPSQGIVLLGEHHENTAHHRWQLDVLHAMYNKQPNMAIGLEMFPQYLQNVLDQWVAKTIDKATFIQRSQWDQIWAYDFDEYLPLFQFARDKNIPLIAINIQKSLLTMAREIGWKDIPENHRQGITDPAKPSKNYLRQLAVSFRRHFDPSVKVDKHAFFRFVEQQQLWDRAMAQGLAINKSKYPLLVGIVGSWHVINGFGVPHQLRDLGQRDITSFVPWDRHLDCGSISDQFADAIFPVDQ
ncbi:MAG: ChaN family lipoprotein [Robiginitomaculum sp.]|nr:ChaN family lipoprotein [Robiginitomaculum sp.]